MLEIPTTLPEITAAWLTKALRAGNAIKLATVTDIRLEQMTGVEGFVATLMRIHLSYDLSETDAPATLIAKLSTADPDLRSIGAKYKWYEREIRFYQEIAPYVNMRNPRCYYCALDEFGEYFVLLLEDLAPAQVGDQITGCSAADAELALIDLAKLHAFYWNSTLLNDMSWAPSIHSREQMNQSDYRRNIWPTCSENIGTVLTDVIREVAKGYGDHMPSIARQMGQCPQTILHGDYRLDNLFFGRSSQGPDFAVVDWQLLKQGPSMCDVAYFIYGNLDVETRQSVEVHLLHRYHVALNEHGVRDYSFAQCLTDYRLSLLYAINVFVEMGAFVNFASKRKAELLVSMVERMTAILQDHGIESLLSSFENSS